MANGNKFTGGGNNNMNTMLRQAKQMQEEMERIQAELDEKTIEASAGGGAVAVTMKGNKEIVSIKIKPEVVDPDDVEMLEDLIVAAVNEASKQVTEMVEDGMGKLTGGFGMPGLF
ncbi:MAG: YbaB/EbfC family nucleoid-associated protein [Clostridia bacterium]|nr:YbaB/EbfC family nucleoid-associated protein [Clostridia bacterium]